MRIMETIKDFAVGEWGEDRLCLLEYMYCVLDGATPLKQTAFAGYHSGAEWLADSLAEHIKSNGEASGSYSLLCKAFVDANADIKDAFETVHDLPCLTTAALQQRGEQLKCWVLGDCSVYLLMEDGEIVHITDNRVARFAGKTVQAKAEAIRRGEDPTAAVLAQRIRNKEMMNRPGGYWTVGFVGDFAEEFVEYSAETERVQAALLCTDGLDRLFVHYDVDPRELLTGEMPLKDALSLLRQKERTGENTDVKRHDDVAAILLDNRK